MKAKQKIQFKCALIYEQYNKQTKKKTSISITFKVSFSVNLSKSARKPIYGWVGHKSHIKGARERYLRAKN